MCLRGQPPLPKCQAEARSRDLGKRLVDCVHRIRFPTAQLAGRGSRRGDVKSRKAVTALTGLALGGAIFGALVVVETTGCGGSN